MNAGAIVEYLVGTYGQGRLIPPPGTPERLSYTFWLHFSEGEVSQAPWLPGRFIAVLELLAQVD